MRHRKSGVKLNRTTSHRQAMFRNMVTSLLKHDRIKTTEPKAKELRKWADHIITLAKRGDLHARRLAMSIVREKDVVHKIFEEAPERFGTRNGGYTRIVKIGRRPGDAAPLTLIELVSTDDETPSKPKKAVPKPDEKPAAPETIEAKEEAQPVKAVDETVDADTQVDEVKQEAKGEAEADAGEVSTESSEEETAKTVGEPKE